MGVHSQNNWKSQKISGGVILGPPDPFTSQKPKEKWLELQTGALLSTTGLRLI
jgi:hypothetical protein